MFKKARDYYAQLSEEFNFPVSTIKTLIEIQLKLMVEHLDVDDDWTTSLKTDDKREVFSIVKNISKMDDIKKQRYAVLKIKKESLRRLKCKSEKL